MATTHQKIAKAVREHIDLEDSLEVGQLGRSDSSYEPHKRMVELTYRYPDHYLCFTVVIRNTEVWILGKGIPLADPECFQKVATLAQEHKLTTDKCLAIHPMARPTSRFGRPR